MKHTFSFVRAAILGAVLLSPGLALAHCDSPDGPVITTAQKALDNGRIEPVLAWVPAANEAEIRAAFESARTARKGGAQAREAADRKFFETLVRVHREGEGAPYTGLAPAGTPDPAVAAADRAVAGDPKQLEELLVRTVRENLHAHVARIQKEKPPGNDVEAGRRWVAAYVPFVHWAEAVYAAAGAGAAHGSGAAGHGRDAAAGAEEAHGSEKPAKKGAADHAHRP